MIMPLVYKISRFFNYIRYDVPRGLKNLIRWFPVIWQDRDWDHWFLYSIMKKKLEQMEHLQENHGMSINSKKYAKQIRVCRILLDRLMKDDYMENALFWHTKKYGERQLDFKDTDYGENWVEMITKYAEPAIDKIKADKDWHRCYEHSEMMQQQDLDLLFKNMNKNIRGWWD